MEQQSTRGGQGTWAQNSSVKKLKQIGPHNFQLWTMDTPSMGTHSQILKIHSRRKVCPTKDLYFKMVPQRFQILLSGSLPIYFMSPSQLLRYKKGQALKKRKTLIPFHSFPWSWIFTIFSPFCACLWSLFRNLPFHSSLNFHYYVSFFFFPFWFTQNQPGPSSFFI